MKLDTLAAIIWLLKDEGCMTDEVKASDISYETITTPTPYPLIPLDYKPIHPRPIYGNNAKVDREYDKGIAFNIYVGGLYVTTYFEYYNRYTYIPNERKTHNPYFITSNGGY